MPSCELRKKKFQFKNRKIFGAQNKTIVSDLYYLFDAFIGQLSSINQTWFVRPEDYQVQ